MIDLESLKQTVSSIEEILAGQESLSPEAKTLSDRLDLLEIEFLQSMGQRGKDPFANLKDHVAVLMELLPFLQKNGEGQYAKFFADAFFKNIGSQFSMYNIMGLSERAKESLVEFSGRAPLVALKSESSFEPSLVMGVASHIIQKELPSEEMSYFGLVSKALSPLTLCLLNTVGFYFGLHRSSEPTKLISKDQAT